MKKHRDGRGNISTGAIQEKPKKNIFEEAVDNLRRHGFDPIMAKIADHTLEKQPATETRNKPNLDERRSASDADVTPESWRWATEGLRSGRRKDCSPHDS